MTVIPSTGEKSNLEFGEFKKRFTIVQDEMKRFKVIKLQKILINLLEAKFLAVRKVTQDNRGKKLQASMVCVY